MKETAEYSTSTIACEDKNPQSKRREEYIEGNKKWWKVQVNLEPIPYFQRMKIVFPSCGSTICFKVIELKSFFFFNATFLLTLFHTTFFPTKHSCVPKGFFFLESCPRSSCICSSSGYFVTWKFASLLPHLLRNFIVSDPLLLRALPLSFKIKLAFFSYFLIQRTKKKKSKAFIYVSLKEAGDIHLA